MLIAWRDYVADSTLTETTGSWEASAPLSNIQTRNIAIVARASDAKRRKIRSAFDLSAPSDVDGAQIGIVSILNNNLPFEHAITLTILDTGLSPIATVGPIQAWIPRSAMFPHNTHIVLASYGFGANVSGVGGIDIEFVPTPDPDGDFWAPTPTPLDIGRIYASPVFVPAGKTARRNFRMQTRDDESVIQRSVGAQAYADVRSRFRQLTCTIPHLTEADAIGTDEDDAANLQDIGFEVGKTQPVIVIPSQATNQLIHKFGTYGTFADPPPVDLLGEAAGRKYETTFDVVEEL